MNISNTYFEINLEKEQRINELRTLYTIDELINHCYDEEQEAERLNNIIDELEKFFKNAFDNEVRPLGSYKISVWTICLDKLEELKEANNEERI